MSKSTKIPLNIIGSGTGGYSTAWGAGSAGFGAGGAVGASGTFNTSYSGLSMGSAIPNNAVLTVSNGGSGANWVTANDTRASLKVDGDAYFNHDVYIQGLNIKDMLDSRFEKIESRLAILRHNANLEERWDELRELGKRYRELEADLLAQEKVFNVLKTQD
jgi:hypothetical protein